MAKNYLKMIEDIGVEPVETESQLTKETKKGEKAPLSVEPKVTPASILAISRYGSLTRGGLRDALWLAVPGLSRADADLVIGAHLESGLIVEGEDGLLMVRQ